MEHVLPAKMLLTLLGKLEAEAGDGPPVCLAIVNSSGKLAAFLRMDGTPDRVISIAQSKAYTAMRMEISTQSFRERLLREQLATAEFCDPAFTSLEGGIPLFDAQGKCIGGLGISGRKTCDDHALATRLANMLTAMHDAR